MQSKGKLIQVYLKYNDPNRLTIVTIKNWRGKALVSTRSFLNELLERKEAKQISVYLLIGQSDSCIPSIYLGETEDFSVRIKNHLEKEFWNKVVFFVSEDLTKAHVQYLERRIYQELSSSGRCELMNGNVPNKGKLPEAEADVMEHFLDEIFLILGVLGYPGLNVEVSKKKESGIPSSIEDLLFVFRRKNDEGKSLFEAFMRTNNLKYVVLKGSKIAKTSPYLEQKHERVKNALFLRENLLSKELLIEENGYYVLEKDVEFSSPSAAGMFVSGVPVNGRVVWKTKDGSSLKEVEKKFLEK